METKEIEKIKLDVLNFSDEDITLLDSPEGVKHLLDVRQLKRGRGAESILLEDSREGLIIHCQSFKKPLEDVGVMALNLFKAIKLERTTETIPSYIN